MNKINSSLKAFTVLTIAGLVALSCTRRDPDQTVMDETTQTAPVEAVPTTRSASVAAGETAVAVPSVVRQAQEQLNRRGYAVSVNGTLDAGTKDAIRNYQKDNKLQTTGSLNSETLNSLQVKAPTSADDNRAPASVAEPIN